MYLVQETEFDRLKSGNVSFTVGLCGMFLGVLVTLVIAALTLTKENSYLKPWFWIGALFALILVVFFACTAISQYGEKSQLIQAIQSTEIQTEVEYTVAEKITPKTGN